MGITHDEGRARAEFRKATSSIGLAQDRTMTAMERDTVLLSLLGGEQQLQGFGGAYSSTVSPYTGRYYIEPSHLAGSKLGMATIKPEEIEEGNRLMQEAEAAARAGDMARANELRMQAEASIAGISATGAGGNIIGRGVAGVGFREDPIYGAYAEAASPTAQLVGSMVGEGRSLMERGEAYEQTYGALTEGALEQIEAGKTLAERSLTGERRVTEMGTADIARGRGAGTNPYLQMQISARQDEMYATRLADVSTQAAAASARVVADASAFLEQYRVDFAKDAVSTALAFVSGRPGSSSSSAMASLNQLAMVQSQNLIDIGKVFQASAEMEEERQEMARMANIKLAVSAVAVIAGGFAGALAYGGAIGALKGAAVGASVGSAATGGGGGYYGAGQFAAGLLGGRAAPGTAVPSGVPGPAGITGQATNIPPVDLRQESGIYDFTGPPAQLGPGQEPWQWRDEDFAPSPLSGRY